MKNFIFGAALVVFLFGCDDDPTSNSKAVMSDGKVHVRVVDESGSPLKDIQLVAIDDESQRDEILRCSTNSLGEAVFEDDFLNDVVALYGQDRLGFESVLSEDTTYVLHSTPRKMRLIGSLMDSKSLIHGDRLISISSAGKYQCVEVDSDGFHNGVVVDLEHEGEITSSITIGDELWISLRYSGIDRYDISDPLRPVFLQSFPNLMYNAQVLTANDSLLIISTTTSSQYILAFFRIYENGAIESLTSIATNGSISTAQLHGDLLIFADRTGLITYDVSDPRHPFQVASAVTSFSGKAYFFDNTVVMITGAGTVGYSRYESYDISNPAAPVSLIRQTIPFYNIVAMATPTIFIQSISNDYINVVEIDNDNDCSIIASALMRTCTAAKFPLVIYGSNVWWID